MATKDAKKDDHPTMEEMVEYGISKVIEAFGKGENLRGAVYSIVHHSAHWGVENHKRYQAERDAEAKKEARKKARQKA